MNPASLIQPIATSFLARQQLSGGPRRVLEALASGRELDRAGFDAQMGADSTADGVAALTGFLLFAIRTFLDDHNLTSDEKSTIRYLRRLFRIEEGALLEGRQEEVGALLAAELARILEDRTVEAAEALHQVDLQEALGLGYDQFIELVRPQFSRVLLHLVAQIDPDKDRVVSEKDLEWYYKQVADLDTVFNLNPDTHPEGTDAGYLYVLVNPSMDGIVKIGKTTRSPTLRSREIGSATGVPTPFLLVFDTAVSNCSAAERYVHERLEKRGLRVANNREFFRIMPPEAIALVQEAKIATAAA